MKVLVASPVRQKDSILQEFLWSLEHLDTAGLEVDYAFVDDHDTESGILKAFAARNGRTQIIRGFPQDDYICSEITHCWQESLMWKVAAYKDDFIRLAGDRGYDYLFLVDSDLMLHPYTLRHLISLKKDIVSEVYWTRWTPGMEPLPQVWVSGQYRFYHIQQGEILSEEEIGKRQAAFINMLVKPGTYLVGGLGACTLISSYAIAKGVSFRKIYNLDLIGEDRHFCIRAAALGLELYADTCCPVYHIYRESELVGLHDYKLTYYSDYRPENPGVTLAMLVRNEAGRYLEQVLRHVVQYVSRVVILDDASDDNTVEICRHVLAGRQAEIVSNPTPKFNNEVVLRKQLWELASRDNPAWILILDADEIFEDMAVTQFGGLLSNPYAEVYRFRLYDMWSETEYREDTYWNAHKTFRPFLVRYHPEVKYKWQETPQHCGRFPLNIGEGRVVDSSLRIKHLGWSKPADRLAKYCRYRELDPECKYGIRGQYLSILDPKPKLIKWVEF